MKVGFALIPTSPFFESIVHIENTLRDECGFITNLGLKENIPHIALFQGTFKDGIGYTSVLKLLKEYIHNQRQILDVHFENISYAHDGWYFYDIRKTNLLQNIHAYTFMYCEPYIILEPDRIDSMPSKPSVAEVTGILSYGYRYSGKAYRPHVTIGRTVDICNEDIITRLSNEVMILSRDVTIGRIAAYEVGENDAYVRTLAELIL